MTKGVTRRFVLGSGIAGLLTSPAVAHDHENMPDGETTRSGNFVAKLINPTTRYDHAVLGDAIEAGGFSMAHRGKRHIFRLGEEAVFEDRRVRLWDVDGDGVPEAVVVKSYLARGAAIAVYKLSQAGITPMAESPAIGTRNRWLNPVGFGPFTGHGEGMIAAVITPHLTGSLRLYRLSAGELREVARVDGYTNHIIGSRDLDLARVIKGSDGLRIVIPTLDRRALALLSFKGGSAVLLAQKTVSSRITGLVSVLDGMAIVRLENGERTKISLV